MITLTAIVLALGLGWMVTRLWNAVSPAPAPKDATAETAKQI